MKNVVQINFDFDVRPAEYEEMVRGVAEAVAAVEGLLWKIWLFDGEARRGGGLYLFTDEGAAQAYLNGPIIAQLRQLPAIQNVDAQCFGFVEGATAVTRGPIYANNKRNGSVKQRDLGGSGAPYFFEETVLSAFSTAN